MACCCARGSLFETPSSSSSFQIYFYWLCRETHAFEWFVDLLQLLEKEMEERGMGNFLTYKLCLTGWDQGHVCKSVYSLNLNSRCTFRVILCNSCHFFLFVSFQATYVMVNFDKDTDVVTGLRQKIHYGRPSWDKEFEQVRKENPT